ncbi:MAG TPA: YeeE/YedE thiosulfate transporter family protein [Anaerolineales bacterium]
MTAALATLLLGFTIGYLGQRSRLCFIAGYRDFFLSRDTYLLKGIAGAFLGALGGFILFKVLGGSVPGFPMLLFTPGLSLKSSWIIAVIGGLGVGFVGALSGGCPFRMHILAAEGKKSYWFYLLGFYVGLIFFNLFTIQYLDMLRSIR